MTRICLLLLLLSLPSMVFFAKAGQIDNLYQVSVPVGGGADNWQSMALQRVLERVSGKSDVSNNATIQTELKNPSTYIKQFEVIRQPDGNQMRVLLDASRVNQLLQQNNIAVWGSLRPDILVWLVMQRGAEREFVRQADATFNIALVQSFAEAALPIMRPLYDIDDVFLLSPTDVWAGFWQQINQASSRYNADEVVAATIDQIMIDDKLLWRLSWQRQHDNRIIRNEVKAVDEASLTQQFALILASELAERYASVMSTESAVEVIIEIQQLDDIAAIVQVQRLLQQIIGISQVSITRYDADKAQYRLTSQISPDSLMSALRFNPRFKMIDSEKGGVAVDVTEQPVLATFNYLRP